MAIATNDITPATTRIHLPTSHIVPLAWEEERPKEFQALLAAAYRLGPARDECGTETSPARLVVKRFFDKFFLARYPETGPLHRLDCPFYGPTSTSIGADVSARVQQLEDGTLRIRLTHGLLRSAAVAGPRARWPQGAERPIKGGQPPLSSLALARLLWQTAELNSWRPSFYGRTRRFIAQRLRAAASDIFVGQHRLEHFLVIFERGARREVIPAVRRLFVESRARRRLIVIGELRSEPVLEGEEAPLFLQAALGGYGISLRMSPEVLQRLERSYLRELGVVHSMAGTILAIAIVEPRIPGADHGDRLCADVREIALLEITSVGIPVDSSYERRVVDLLVKQKRSFVRPLRLSDGEVLPDFELVDAGDEPIILEVFGRTDEAYRARMREKMARYDEVYGRSGWWFWDPLASENPPAFPKRVFRASDVRTIESS